MTALRRTAPVVLIALLLALAGCGGDDEGAPIPADTAAALQGELDNVQARLDNGSAGACRDILEGEREPNDDRVNELIASLPDDVDADVRSALEDSFNQLWELVQQDCDDKAQQEEESTPEPEQTPTEPLPEDTTPTTPEETTPTTPGEETIPPEGDGDNGGVVPPVDGNGDGGGAGPGDGE
jgi:hypothetical protein